MYNLFTVSDSTGETVNQIANAILIQFPNLEFVKKRFSNINTLEACQQVFDNLPDGKTIILVTVAKDEIATELKELAKGRDEVLLIDLLANSLNQIEEFTNEKATRKAGLIRVLDNDYFDKIEAIEFAMNFDDGKNPAGFLEADIVLLGVSRTSKTPLSVYLANKSYKVANLPLVPEVSIPKEIYQVDTKKLIGLIIDPEKLNEIRNERLKTLGLSIDSAYAQNERIQEELDFAKGLFDELGCVVIDVSTSTIEETAAKIIEHIEN